MPGQCYVVHFGEKLKAGSRRMVSSAGFKYDDHDDNEEDYECLTDNKDNTGVSVMNMYPRFSNTIDNVHDNDNEKLYGLQIVGGEARKC